MKTKEIEEISKKLEISFSYDELKEVLNNIREIKDVFISLNNKKDQDNV